MIDGILGISYQARKKIFSTIMTDADIEKARAMAKECINSGYTKCGNYGLAERQGFEPWRRLPAYTLSRRAPSTTRPPLHRKIFYRLLLIMQDY